MPRKPRNLRLLFHYLDLSLQSAVHTKKCPCLFSVSSLLAHERSVDGFLEGQDQPRTNEAEAHQRPSLSKGSQEVPATPKKR